MDFFLGNDCIMRVVDPLVENFASEVMMARMSARQFFQEARGILSLYQADEDDDVSSAPRFSKNEVVLFLPGLGAAPFVYQRVAARLSRQSGVPNFFPHFGTRVGNLNLLTLDESLRLLNEEIKRLHQLGKVVAGIVGHSLGGIQGAAALAQWPEIPFLFAIGSPIWGTPWLPLARFASSCLGFDIKNPPPHFIQMRERLPLISNRIITFSSPGDIIAPPRRCQISGATNIVLSRRTARNSGERHVRTVHVDCIAHPTVTHMIARYLRERDQPFRACAS